MRAKFGRGPSRKIFVGQVVFKVRVSIRTCVPNLGAVRRERFLTIDNPLNPPGVGWVKFLIFFKERVSIRTCMPNLGAVRRERFLTIDNPLNPPWGGSIFFLKVRVSIRTCVPNLGAVRRNRSPKSEATHSIS